MTEHRIVVALSTSEIIYGPWGPEFTEKDQKAIDEILSNYPSVETVTLRDQNSDVTFHLNPKHIMNMYQETR